MLRLIRGSFALLAVLLVGLTNAGGSLTIAFVPMYATPVARQLPLMLGAIARIDVREPPRATLGGYIEPGDVSAVAAWLKSPTLRHAGAFIVSTDMVAYGGLDPSRVPGGVDTQLALSRLKLFAALRKTRPHAWIAAFGTIMRLEPTAVAPVGAAASYDPIARYPLWEYILEYAKLHTPPQPDEADRARPRRRPSHPGDGRRSYDRPGRARPGRCGARRSAHPGRAGPPRSRRASRDRGSRIDRAGRRRARPGTRSACDGPRRRMDAASCGQIFDA